MRIEPARLTDAKVAFGNRVLWSGLNLIVEPGEFIAVLGPNGVGKTTLLRVLLGQIPLTAGTAMVAGRPVRRGSTHIGLRPPATIPRDDCSHPWARPRRDGN